MSERPRLPAKFTLSDRVVEVAGWAIIIETWILVLLNYAQLPETIPTHYNGSGVADGFGEKQMIFALPFLGTVLFIGMTVLNKFPHKFNYRWIQGPSATNPYFILGYQTYNFSGFRITFLAFLISQKLFPN